MNVQHETIHRLISELKADIQKFREAYGIKGWPSDTRPDEWIHKLDDIGTRTHELIGDMYDDCV